MTVLEQKIDQQTAKLVADNITIRHDLVVSVYFHSRSSWFFMYVIDRDIVFLEHFRPLFGGRGVNTPISILSQSGRVGLDFLRPTDRCLSTGYCSVLINIVNWKSALIKKNIQLAGILVVSM